MRESSHSLRLDLIAETYWETGEDEVLARVVLDRMRVVLLQRSHEGRRRPDDTWLHPAAVLRILRAVTADPSGRHRLRDIAAETGLSLSACIRAMRGAVGLTPCALIGVARAVAAAEALRDTAQTQNRVATMAGYSSASHLNMAMRRCFDASPGQLRLGMRRRPEIMSTMVLAQRAIAALGDAVPGIGASRLWRSASTNAHSCGG